MKITSTFLWTTLLRLSSFGVIVIKPAFALFPDEAGLNDFTIASAGHGQFGVTYAYLTSDGKSILTSSSSTVGIVDEVTSSSASSSSLGNLGSGTGNSGCYLASRSLENGKLNWRRNVCSQSLSFSSKKINPRIRHAVYSNDKNTMVYTLDNLGILREWDDTNGDLIQEKNLNVVDDAADADNGKDDLIQMLHEDNIPRLIPFSEDIVAAVQMIRVLDGKKKDSVTLFKMSDLSIVRGDSTLSAHDILKQATVKPLGGDIDIKDDVAQSLAKKGVVTTDGKGILQCDNIVMTISNGAINLLSLKDSDNIVPTNFSLDESDTKLVKVLKCDDGQMIGFISSQSGSTALLEINYTNEQSPFVTKKWTAEESLGSVTSTTFLDWSVSHGIDQNNEDNEDNIIASLSFLARLNSQWDNVVSFFTSDLFAYVSNLLGQSSGTSSTNSDGKLSQKEVIFGLKKVAVLLSNSLSKLMGIDTSEKGNIIWSMNLNPNAIWHKVIHGATTNRSSVLGHGMHHPHSPEILVLSHLVADAIEWKCIDGLKGSVVSSSTVPLSAPVSQIIPVHAHSHAGGGCKQNALLLLEDDSVLTVPSTTQSVSETTKLIDTGLYTHKIDNDKGLFTSMKIRSEESSDHNKAMVIGETAFDPSMEKIVNVVYPQRNEVVQSPATISGDDSLLLKYLNPHLCVVVTEATSTYIELLHAKDQNEFLDALSSSKSGAGSERKQSKKPVGATKPGEEVLPASKTKPAAPTLFINLIDTVSGQILHRVSHAHAAPDASTAGATNVPVVISENWIVYAFPNVKSRRTELGVLTLYEGMIDKHGITAFSSPEQQETFSSLTSSKPIVLAKTYALAVPVSAIGVTNTKNGISSKNILLSSGVGGQVIKVDRRLLDPRRPSGEPKESEKKEGLMQYTPLLPTTPFNVQSYTNNIEEASFIQSTAANLESQTLIIAYGGPDIFFTRFAPSKGFDSLPESFNKLAILMVLFALYIVLNALKTLSERKMVKIGWL